MPKAECEAWDFVRAELDHQHARHEVDRLQLIVRLLGATEGRHG